MPEGGGSGEARLRVLTRLTRLVSSSLDPADVLPAISRAAAELMAAPCAVFWIVNERDRRLEPQAFSDPVYAADFPIRSIGFDEGGGGWVATHRRALDVSDVSADPRIVAPEWWRAHGLTSYHGVPVVLGERLLAVLALTGSAPFDFGRDDLDLLDSFVAQAAIALGNARSFADVERRRREAEALAAVGRVLSRTLDVSVVAELIAENVRTVLGGLSSAVYRIDDSDDLVVMATSTGAATVAWSPRGTGVAGLAVRMKAPVATPDVLADPRITEPTAARADLERSDYRAVLAVPFTAQDRVIGALTVSDRAGRAFDEGALALAQAFADQAAVALENARLFEETRERQRAAEEAEARYRGLFDRVPIGLFRTTPDGGAVDANPAMMQILDYADRDALLAVNAALHWADSEEMRRIMTLLERDGVVRELETRLRRRDGSTIWVRGSARAVRDATGRTLYYEGSVADATEARRAAESQRQAESLARVAQLANAAAHEINNPLSIVVGRLQLLERQLRSDAAAGQHIREAIAASHRITEMLGHMRRITRLEMIEKWSSVTPILDLRRSSTPD